jgi:hypothetical protein
MTTSQVTFKLPPIIAEQTQPDPLESLRSPQLDETFNNRSLGRESVAVSEFNDIALDDDSFSAVTLPGRADGVEEVDISQLQNDSDTKYGVELPSELPRTDYTSSKSHRKTASTTTIRSFHDPNVSLLMNRLELQEGGRARGSVDGQLKLQEEFARLHEKEAKEHTAAEGVIDWGQYHLSVYETFD